MKKSKKIISICLSLLLALQMTPSVFGLSLEHINSEGETVKLTDFLDTKGHWAYNQIYKWAEYGLIAGNNGYFMPNSPIKRGDLAIIVDRMLGLKTTTYNFYNDLPNEAYYREALLRCVAAGYIAGTGTNTVSPEGFATREQVAVIIARMFNLDTGYSGNTGFKDDASIGSWAKSSIYAMKRLGYMNGNEAGNVMPKSYITRAELVTILSNIANTYIPKSDKSGQGNAFTGQYPTNIITSRNIELSNASVGRDVVLTQASSSFTATNTNIMGRLYVMGRNTINLSNTSVAQIYLVDGKSTINGVSDKIDEIYVAKYATESTLDAIPECIVLESGVRVRIDGVMYENETSRTKTYYGIDIKADIADEQNYVVGGPRITGTKFSQDQDNTITVSNVIVNKNGTEIDEIGVIWLDQENDTDVVNPSYQNYDGKKVYKTNKFTDPISFTVDTVDGIRAYRVYVKDSDGLFAYSDTTVFSEYEYTTNLKIYGENYPESVDVEIVMQGDSIPDINTVRVVYGYDGIYNEDLDEVTLRLYSNPDAEVQPDKTKYRRYIATINSDTERVNGETIYNPPTHFGYIINYKNGTIVNKYPVLSNVIPDGVSPMSKLSAGSASYSGNYININDSIVQTRYVVPQEVGIVYQYSNSENITAPINNASGWNRNIASVNVGLGETAYYNNTIPGNDDQKYTYYAAYVKTSNGYWYSDVKKIVNNLKGDPEGAVIYSLDYAITLTNDRAVLGYTIRAIDSYNSVDLDMSYIIVNNQTYALSSLETKIRNNDNDDVELSIGLENLKSSNTVSLCIYNKDGFKSNTFSNNLSMSNPVKITASNEHNGKYGVAFDLIVSNLDGNYVLGSTAKVISGTEYTAKIYNNVGRYYVEITNLKADESLVLSVPCEYRPEGFIEGFKFNVEVNIR